MSAAGGTGGEAAARELLAGPGQGSGDGDGGGPGGGDGGDRTEPCLRCAVPLPVRLMGCRGGHCPNCGHPYPHGDCSD